MVRFTGLAVLVLLTACAEDGSQNYVRTVHGTVLGSAEQRDIALRDSQVDLGVPDLAVRTRRGRSLADRYDETVNFGSGFVRFQRFIGLGFSGSSTNIGAIQGMVDTEWYRERGLTQPVRDLRTVVNQHGRAQYAMIENREWRCAVFSQYFWTGGSFVSSPGDSELRGANCYLLTNGRAATLEADTVALLQRVRLGPGVNASAAPAPAVAPAPASAAASSPIAPLAPASAPVTPSLTTTAGLRIAPPGTRFVTAGGYLQIVRVDGSMVVTVNAANQTGRWIEGVIPPRDNATLDPTPLASLFPLAVGKETKLEERSGSDRWEYTIRVTGSERLTVQGRAYETFAIAVRDRSLTPDQGGFDRTRTLWYAPEVGGALRMRSTQAGGPPVRLFDWDVIEIVPPR
jgi:hypothetical protein